MNLIKGKKDGYLLLLWLVLGVSILWLTAACGLRNKSVKGWVGKHKGVWHWQLPNTPNGLKPGSNAIL